MPVKKFELVVNHNNTSGVVQVVQEDASGRPIDPSSLKVDEAFVMAFASLFSDAQQATIATLTAEKETAITARDVAISDKQTAQAQAVTLTTENAALQTQVDTIPALQTKIDSLLGEVNFDPRVISSAALFDRLSGKELFALGNAKDAMTMQIAELFDAYQINKWRVEFDSMDYLHPIGYLISQGVLTEARAKGISRDATRAEAYFAPE